MVEISVAIMAHKKRERFIPELVGQLDRKADLVWDKENDRWETGRRALLAYQKDATHHCVVQDDAIVCKDLIAGLENAIKFVPERSAIGLYVGKVRPYREIITRMVESTQQDTSWLRMSQLHWGVGVVLPTDLIDQVVAWGDGRPDILNYDKRISRWLGHNQIPVYYTWPSLVEHRTEDNPSLIPARTAKRSAHRFLGADRSALDLDWGGKVLEVKPSQKRGVYLANSRYRKENRRAGSGSFGHQKRTGHPPTS